MGPPMCAKRKYPRTACMGVFTDDVISPYSTRCRMKSSTWARRIPTSGWRWLVSHQPNQRRSWASYAGATRVPREEGRRGELCSRHRVGLERQKCGS